MTQEKKSLLTEPKQERLRIAAMLTNNIKQKLDDIKWLDVFPVAQLKDISNTLDNLHRKAQVAIDKEERMNRS